MWWPPNITALLVAFAEAFQGIEVTGKMALKTGKIFSESTDNQQKRRKEKGR